MPKVEIDVDDGTHKLLQALADLHAHRALKDAHGFYAHSLGHRYPPSDLSEDEKRREDRQVFERAVSAFSAKVIWDGLVVNVRRMYHERLGDTIYEEFPEWHAWDRIARDAAMDPKKWLEPRKGEIEKSLGQIDTEARLRGEIAKIVESEPPKRGEAGPENESRSP